MARVHNNFLNKIKTVRQQYFIANKVGVTVITHKYVIQRTLPMYLQIRPTFYPTQFNHKAKSQTQK